MRQGAMLTGNGVQPMSDWEEIEPVDAIHKEIAVDFAAEQRVEELLLDVRRIMVTLFGGIIED